MARRHIHYEAAFEDFVRSRGWPYLPVDEQKKAIFSGARIKSFDFLVYPTAGKGWLVDIKGRQFPYDLPGGKRYWENWVTRDDLEGLRRWEGVFGPDFEPLLVFVYWLREGYFPDTSADIHVFRDQSYAFMAVSASEYSAHARERSPKWNTLSVPMRTFKSLVRPIQAAG